MRIAWITVAVVSLCQAAAVANPDPIGNYHTIHVFHQPATEPFSHDGRWALATVKYNTSSLESEVVSYTPPDAAQSVAAPHTSHPLLRISTDAPSKSTTATSLAAFHPAQNQTLALHLDEDGVAFSASISPEPLPYSSSSAAPSQSTSQLRVELIPAKTGPTPKLVPRQPVVLDEDGNEMPEAAVPEKTFFQKYWWALALVSVLALTSGGGDGK